MTTQLVIAPLLVALVTAVCTLPLRRWTRAQQAVSLLGVLAYAVAVAAQVSLVLPDRTVTYQLGDWPAPFGITLVADPLSAFMLSMAAVVAVPSLVASIRYLDEFGQQLSYHTLFHLMLVGVTGSFLTGDIFNLFVWFEVMLMSSYVLVVFFSGPDQTLATMKYVALNLVGSAVMLFAIGGIYAVTGTLNMADLARRLADPSAYSFDPAPVLGLSALLFVVFALKAGLVPFHFWVPSAYQAAPNPVAAMLAGVVKKVGVYAFVRLYFTVFAAASLDLSLPLVSGSSPLDFFGPVFLLLAASSVVFGGLAAVDSDSLEELLAYSSVGQVGFIVLPLAVGAAVPSVRPLAIAATLVYALNHALAKSLLFLVTGVVRDGTGTTRFADLGGLTGEAPVVSAAFFVGGLSLVGIPPLTGFFAKFLVFNAAATAGAVPALAVALGGALLTIAYVSRAWNRAFWGAETPAVDALRTDSVQVATVAVLALVVVLVGVGFDPVYRFAEHAAATALDRGQYVDAVLGGETT
ncbi:complex I subunit 5 family protein [Halospeciosus flavus]|uniref:Complex I subunit 5 family protein n=1 Tax=Halospeciosus flavus TaxID=3032283 RepID=A0ABD5Z4C3_9EURY|nr:proton-conducting transporter membrane subunit [Halospeciosus flavus]